MTTDSGNSGKDRQSPGEADPEATLQSDPYQPRPSGFEETIKTPPPALSDTMATVPAVPVDHDAPTLHTPPPGVGGDQTQVTAAGFQSDHTMATVGPGSTDRHHGSVEPSRGEIWGDFEIGDLLGRGGMGAVYCARQISLDRPVALKVLPQHLSHNEDFRKRFVLEARSVARISCPNIIQVIAAGEHAGNLYFAMEYVEGLDLSARIKKGFKPTPDQALSLVLQAARGLAEAGDHHLVHRDIKPSNMMVTKDGRLKIMDFGLVKQAKSSEGLTLAGTVMGTVTYFSPEQGRGDDIDHRTDIYALGVVFYELLTGRLPFTGDDPSSIIYQHLHAEPKPPRELNPAIPESYEAVVLACMQKDPDDRYATAHALIADLEAARDGQKLSAAAQTQGTGRTLAKHQNASRKKGDAGSASGKSPGKGIAITLLILAAAGGGGAYAWTQHNAQVRELLGLPVAAPPAQPVGPVTDDPPPARSGDLERAQALLAAGDLEAVRVLLSSQHAAGELEPGWQAIADRLERIEIDALVGAARSALTNGDGSAAEQPLQALQERAPDLPAVAELREQFTLQEQAASGMRAAKQAINAGNTQQAMADLAGIAPQALPDAQRSELEALTAEARAVGKLLDTGMAALAGNDLETARQAFGSGIDKYDNQAAADGLQAVTLCKSLNDALAAGAFDKAAAQIDQLASLPAFADLALARRGELTTAQAVTLVEQAIGRQDFAAAEQALADLRGISGDSRTTEALAHRLELERRVQAFERALANQDLTAATAALTAIKTHDGEREAWRVAARRLDDSRLREQARAEQLQQMASQVQLLLDADQPDFALIDKTFAAYAQEAGADAPKVVAMRVAIATRKAKIAIASSLATLDRAVLAADGPAINAVVRDQDHAGKLQAMAGFEGLTFAHSLDNLVLDDEGALAEVSVRTASTTFPETVIRYRYQMASIDDGWRVTAVSDLP